MASTNVAKPRLTRDHIKLIRQGAERAWIEKLANYVEECFREHIASSSPSVTGGGSRWTMDVPIHPETFRALAARISWVEEQLYKELKLVMPDVMLFIHTVSKYDAWGCWCRRSQPVMRVEFRWD